MSCGTTGDTGDTGDTAFITGLFSVVCPHVWSDQVQVTFSNTSKDSNIVEYVMNSFNSTF